MKPIVSQRTVEWRVLGAAAAAWILSLVLVNALVYRGAVGDMLGELRVATGGLIEPTLMGSLLVLLAFAYGLWGAARLRLCDLGWTRRNLAPAIVTVVAFWAVMQVALYVIAVTQGEDVALHSAWQRMGAGALLGGVFAQLFGNALAEETVFRGFFFTQFRLKTQTLGRLGSFAVAAAGSAVLFAVSHIPNRLLVEQEAISHLLADQVQLAIAGLIFAGVFALTRNLFTTVGLHALANDPAPVVAASNETIKGTYLALLCAVLLGYGLLRLLRPPSSAAAGQRQELRP